MSISRLKSGVKSIQRGTFTVTSGNASGTDTITAVNTARSELHLLGSEGSGGVTTLFVKLVLTNATTITATRNGTGADVNISWEVVEYF